MTDKTIARILRVNHAGEYGAIRIYGAQVMVARVFYTDLLPFLDETKGHEVEHAAKFRAAMVPRRTGPCAAMPLWGIGGWLLGFVTACAGRNAIMVCTAAVERTVHRHLEDQIRYLEARDPELRDLILGIQDEEMSHLNHAEHHIRESWLVRPLTGLIRMATELLIFLSTQGDVSRMRRAIAPG